MLADLWTYVRGAGYCLPDNLPGGLDVCSDCLIALLSELEYVRPVALSTSSEATYSGLHYIPPAQKESTRIVVLDHRSDV
jgi:hypothetical protein